jgi:Rieske Fe-S protein
VFVSVPSPTRSSAARPVGEDPERRRFFGWFLGSVVAAWLGAIVYPIFAYLRPPKVAEPTVSSVLVCRKADLRPGTSKVFQFGRKPGLLIHTATGDLRAFDATCTHLDCTVQYREDWNLIWCACHNGRYDLTGRNVSGPPPRPLTPLRIETRGEEIYVHRA